MAEMKSLHDNVESILYTKEDLDKMLTRLANEITSCYRSSCQKHKLIFVGVLKGSFIFMADLIRKIDLPSQVLFLTASSYGDATVSSGNVKVQIPIREEDLRDADVVLVEDILDSGRTLAKLSSIFQNYGAHSVRICTMLNKPARRAVPIDVDFIGYEVGDEFLIGYGLDYNELYRNLPYIGVLKREIYS